MTNWFALALQRELHTRGLQRQADLARLVGKPTATISRWIRAIQTPAFNDLCEVADKLGWELDGISPAKLRPGDPWTGPPTKKPEVVGRIKEGAASLSPEEPDQLAELAELWASSRHHKQVRPGSIVYLAVEDGSMEPDLPKGALLACGRPVTERLKPLTPVIARADGKAAFRLFRRFKDLGDNWQVELIPPNDVFAIERHRPKEVEVEYVVLGMINPWNGGAAPKARQPSSQGTTT